jgi:hypothetical protein
VRYTRDDFPFYDRDGTLYWLAGFLYIFSSTANVLFRPL